MGISVPIPAGDALCFRRGDANGDRRNDVADPVFVLSYLFLGGTSLCLDAMDADDDGEINITDAITLLDWLFRGGPAPPTPGPFECGPDTTESSLGCELYESCRGSSD